LPVRQALKAHRVFRVLRVIQVILAQLDPRACKDFKA
jgi:hypothetical protein